MRRLHLAASVLLSAALGCSPSSGESAPSATTLPSSPARTDDGAAQAPASNSTLASAPLTTTVAPPAAKPFVDYAINHVIITGQSNSVANGGDPVLTTSQPYSNLMFDTGVFPVKNCDGDGCWSYDMPHGFVPLVEGDKFFDYAVETSSSGTANEISLLAMQRYGMAKHDVLVSVNGRSGNTYWCLRKGGCSYHPDAMTKPFQQAMDDVTNAKQLADAAGLSYGVRAVNAIHGESDHYGYTGGTPEFPLDGSDGTPNALKDYSDALLEWQRDYDASVKAITGQQNDVPLFIAQMSTWSDTAASPVAQFQLDAHAKSNGKVVLVTPGYALTVREDCIHYDADGERRLGEYFAKAYAKTIIGGETWEPVRPKHVTIAGTTVSVQFHVPKAPLVLDTDRVLDPGNFGFQVYDAWGNAMWIDKVSLTSADTVAIEVAGNPSGGKVTYAMNHKPGNCIGPWQGARGNLRDSDDTPSQNGYELFNWAVHFESKIP